MADATPLPLYDTTTRRFNPERLRWEMTARGVSRQDLRRQSGLCLTSIAKAEAGKQLLPSTAVRILQTLNDLRVMEIAQDCVA